MASWFYGPNGQADVFDECPDGWFDHPSLVPDAPGGPPSLMGKNKAALLQIATDEGVELAEGATNKQIAAAIEAAREAA